MLSDPSRGHHSLDCLRRISMSFALFLSQLGQCDITHTWRTTVSSHSQQCPLTDRGQNDPDTHTKTAFKHTQRGWRPTCVCFLRVLRGELHFLSTFIIVYQRLLRWHDWILQKNPEIIQAGYFSMVFSPLLFGGSK